MSEKYYIGRDIMSFEDNGDRKPISRVTLLLDGETGYTSGDDTGAELTAECYFATQEMADALLERVKGYTYRAFAAGRANLDPAAELGDGVTASGIYSVIASLSDNGSGYPDVSAPGDQELEDEYEMGSPLMKSIERSLATVRAELRVDIDSITSTVEGLEGNISKIDQRVDSITLSVSSSEGSTTFTLEADGATLSTKTLDLSVDAVNISGKLNANQLNISGSITFDDLDTDAQDAINEAYYLAYDAVDIAEEAADTVSGWTYGSTTYIDGTRIMTGTVRASTLEGGEILLLDSAGREAGIFELTGASSASYAIQLYSTGALRFWSEFGNIYLDAESATGGTTLHLQESNIAVICDSFLSGYDSDLGLTGSPWNDVYANNTTIQTSDRTKKHSIVYGLDAYDALFDALRPVSFLFNDGSSGRRHLGVISQDVENALTELGISTEDFAAFIKSTKLDENYNPIEGEYDYAFRYGEIIPLNTWQIQQLKPRMKTAEFDITDLKARVAELEAAVYG